MRRHVQSAPRPPRYSLKQNVLGLQLAKGLQCAVQDIQSKTGQADHIENRRSERTNQYVIKIPVSTRYT